MALSEMKRISNANGDRENMKRMSLVFRADEYALLKEPIRRTRENTSSFIRRAIASAIRTDNDM